MAEQQTKVRKAVFPVAGMGTRFLPATKANPKEMLPIVDKPLIQYAVEEALSAGITELIFVTSSSKHAIEDHFDTNFELESKLLSRNKMDLYHLVRNVLPSGITSVYVRQAEPLGLGHAVLCAKNIVGDEPFAVLLADDLIDNRHDEKVCMQQMVSAYNKTNCSVIAVQPIEAKETDKYGIIDLNESWSGFNRITGIIEKPKPDLAPSHLAAVGRYVLTPGIFRYLESGQPGAGSEIQLTDAIAKLIEEEYVYALEFTGTRYDCGSKLGYIEASLVYALQHPEIGEALRARLPALLAASRVKIDEIS
jgi:UTP--glucose-1-phosphate uridylyltransferase